MIPMPSAGSQVKLKSRALLPCPPLADRTPASDLDTVKVTKFQAQCRIDTPVEVDYYRIGGILHPVLRKLLKTKSKKTAKKPANKKSVGNKATSRPERKASAKK